MGKYYFVIKVNPFILVQQKEARLNIKMKGLNTYASKIFTFFSLKKYFSQALYMYAFN